MYLSLPLSLRHANLLNFLDRLLAEYIELLDLGVLYREVGAIWLSSRNVGPKFAEYEQHEVNDCLILDPETPTHRFYRREGELPGA